MVSQTTSDMHGLFKILEKSLKISSPDQWYHITYDQITKCKHGCYLLKKFDNSPFRMISFFRPEFHFLPWRFKKTPIGFWRKESNRIDFFRWLITEKKLPFPEGLYSLTVDEVKKEGANGLLKIYNYSLIKALESSFRGISFKFFLFKQVPKNSWRRAENILLYSKYLEEKLGIENPADWYNVTLEKLFDLGASGLLNLKFRHSLVDFVKYLYPNY